MSPGSIVEVIKPDNGYRNTKLGIRQICEPLVVGEILTVEWIGEVYGQEGLLILEKKCKCHPDLRFKGGYTIDKFRELFPPAEESIESLIEQPVEHA